MCKNGFLKIIGFCIAFHLHVYRHSPINLPPTTLLWCHWNITWFCINCMDLNLMALFVFKFFKKNNIAVMSLWLFWWSVSDMHCPYKNLVLGESCVLENVCITRHKWLYWFFFRFFFFFFEGVWFSLFHVHLPKVLWWLHVCFLKGSFSREQRCEFRLVLI